MANPAFMPVRMLLLLVAWGFGNVMMPTTAVPVETSLNNTGIVVGACLNNTGVPGTGSNNTGVPGTGFSNTGAPGTGLNNIWVPVWTGLNNTEVPVANEDSWSAWGSMNDLALLEHQQNIDEARNSLKNIENEYQKPSVDVGDAIASTFGILSAVFTIFSLFIPAFAPVATVFGALGAITAGIDNIIENQEISEDQMGQYKIRRELLEFRKEMNSKLLGLKLQLDRMVVSFKLELNNVAEEIRSDNEFQTWFSLYTNWDNTIRNGAEKLANTVVQMQSTNETNRLRAAQDFIDYYREQDVEGAAKNILRLTTATGSTIAPNILKIYMNHRKCDIKGLSNLMIIIFDISINYAIQASANGVLKGYESHIVEQQIKDINEQLHKSREQYQELVWDCIRTSINRAEDTVKTYLMKNPQATGSQLTNGVYTELRQVVPWYSWAVVQYENLVCSDPQSRSQSFTVSDIPTRKLLVMWQDPDDTNSDCSAINARNFVPFFPCSNCVRETSDAGDAFLTGQKCGRRQTSDIIHAELDCPRSEMSQNISFLASGFKPPANPCEGRDCSNHGTCETIPDTSEWMCVCHRHYHGRDCERRFNPLMENQVMNLMTNMRQNLGTFLGVPDVISVYSEIQNARLQITSVQESITSSLDSLETSLSSNTKIQGIINLYSEVFTKGEYITDEYKKLLTKEITEDEFYETIKPLNFNFHYFYYNLRKLVIGDGIAHLDDEDLYLLHRKLQTPYCTREYKDKIKYFAKSILLLDERVAEVEVIMLTAPLRHLEPSKDTEDIWNPIVNIANKTLERQQLYLKHWENTSCPALTNDTRIRQHHCDKYSSFEGLTVTIECDDPLEVKPSIESVSCIRENGKLVWSSIPRCVEHDWGSWGAWSSCRKSCAGSWERTRIRRKPNSDTQTEAVPCDTQDYCHERYNTEKSQTTCPSLRVGQCIYLENEWTKRALDGTSNPDYATMTQCDEENWHMSHCLRDIMLKVEAQGRGPGDAIHHGDQVALRVVMRGPYWIKQNYMTEVAECPGDTFNENDWTACTSFLFTILSPLSRCPCNMNDTSSGCKGEPIQINDYVFLKEHGRDYYLTDLYNWPLSLDMKCILDPSTCKSYMWRVRQIQ